MNTVSRFRSLAKSQICTLGRCRAPGPRLPQVQFSPLSLSSPVRMAKGRETLKAAPRSDFGSRTSRRLRREGLVPGIVYSGGAQARPFQVAEREVRSVLGEGAALFDLEIEGGKAVPVVVKEQQLHPVRGSLQHIDLQEVRLDEAIQAEVAVDLEGIDSAPGVKGGGVLEHVTREVTVEALPTEIPDRIVADVSAMEINDTLQLSALVVPEGVTLVADDPEEVTIATLSPPRVEEEPEPSVEEEAELVGEEGEAAAAEDGGDGGDSGDSGGEYPCRSFAAAGPSAARASSRAIAS